MARLLSVPISTFSIKELMALAVSLSLRLMSKKRKRRKTARPHILLGPTRLHSHPNDDLFT